MVLRKQPIYRRGFFVLMLLLLAAACSQGNPTSTPEIITTTPVPHTPVPTFDRYETATPTPLPTEPLVMRDALTGNGDSLYVRDKPSTMGTITQQVNADDAEKLNFVGRSDDSRWVQAKLADGSTGWLLARGLNLSTDLDKLPVTGTAENVDFVGLVSPDAAKGVSLYASPQGSANVVATLPALTPLRLDGRRDDGIWIHAQTADSKEGWIQRSLVELNFDIGLLAVMNVTGLDNGTEVVQARVLDSAGALRRRSLPDDNSTIIGNLNAGTSLTIEGRTPDNAWLLIKSSDGYEGWVNASYVEVYIDLAQVAAVSNPNPVPPNGPTPPPNAINVSSIGGGARQIYLSGQSAGNQRNVFSTVGDSLTDSQYFLRPLANGYNLRDYGYLLPMVQFFSSGNALGGNPFVSGSISAHAGWGEVSVLDPGSADHGRCNSGETPVACEMRVVRPAVAIILIGTNDSPAFSADVYGSRLKQIVDTCIQYNVVPILSTIPPRAQYNDNVVAYNQVITQMASSYGIPLTDLYSAMVNLPNHGYGDDGIHPSVPPGGPPATVDFTPANLQYGTTVRNLTVLQVLDTVWKQVLY